MYTTWMFQNSRTLGRSRVLLIPGAETLLPWKVQKPHRSRYQTVYFISFDELRNAAHCCKNYANVDNGAVVRNFISANAIPPIYSFFIILTRTGLSGVFGIFITCPQSILKTLTFPLFYKNTLPGYNAINCNIVLALVTSFASVFFCLFGQNRTINFHHFLSKNLKG